MEPARKARVSKTMDTKRIVAMLLIAAPSAAGVDVYAADMPPADVRKDAGKQGGSVNPPMAAEPVNPGTSDRLPQAVAPGTADAPPKPVAPGTLDNNVRNPDAEIRSTGKPVPK
jgi:hypothetical protein